MEMEKYEKVKKLGSGSFGSAILVKRRQDRQLFVVKEVNLARMNPREREEARNECKVLQLLIHPNVIRYEEHFERRNVLYIVMEYADGGDLHQKVVNQKNNLMREDTVLHYFVQMCLALDYLHSRHILHRDIKAMNVFLTSNGTVKLGDFGISTILRNTMGMANTVCGTPYYFSPELCKNKPYNNKTDVWALGVVLYEMLALRHPFDASNLNQLMQRILRNPTPNIPSVYSPQMREIVEWCLMKEHQKRPSVRSLLTMDIIKRALIRLQGDLGAATNANQRLQQIVAERVSAEPLPIPSTSAVTQQPNNNNNQGKAVIQQQQQQQNNNNNNKYNLVPQQQQQAQVPPPVSGGGRAPSPQPFILQQQQQQKPVVAIHDYRRPVVGGNVAPAAQNANVTPPTTNLVPPPPPPANYQKPTKGLAERMAEMEKQRAARIKQLEQERKEAEEREKKEIDEARKAAAARVAANRQRKAEIQAEREKREKEERDARRKVKRNPSIPDSGRGGGNSESPPPPSGRNNNNDNIVQQQQQPVSGRNGVQQQIRPAVPAVVAPAVPPVRRESPQPQPTFLQAPPPPPPQQHKQQPAAVIAADPRPAVSNAYLQHLRDIQANRDNNNNNNKNANPVVVNNNNQQQQRQQANDWVEREQARRMSQQQQNAGRGIADLFGGGGGAERKPSPQQVQPDKDVEKWLQDEQRKKWYNNNPQSQQQQQQAPVSAGAVRRDSLPPMMQQQQQQVGGNNNNNRNPRPMTPPPSPTQHLKPKRKFGAVEPLVSGAQQQQQPSSNNNNNQQQQVGKKLILDPNPIQLAHQNLMNDFARKQQQKGQNNNNNNNRDRSAPPVLSPVRQAPITDHLLYPEDSAVELAGDAEMLEIVPSKSGGYSSTNDGDDNALDAENSDEAIDAHEQLIMEGQVHNRMAEEKRFKEYNAMGHHIATLLQVANNNNNKNQQQKQQQNNNNNDDDFQEDTMLEEEDDDVPFEDNNDQQDDDALSESNEDVDLSNPNNPHNNNNNNRPPPQISGGTKPPLQKQNPNNLHQQQQQQNKLGGNNNNIQFNQNNNQQHQAGTTTTNTFPLLHLCGGVAFSRWWQSVGNTQEEAQALRAALSRRLKRDEVVAQIVQLLNMACTSVNGTDGSLAVNMWKMVDPFVNQVRKVVRSHVVKAKLLPNATSSGEGGDEVVDCFVDEIVQTASRVVFFEGYATKHNNINKPQQQQIAAGVARQQQQPIIRR